MSSQTRFNQFAWALAKIYTAGYNEGTLHNVFEDWRSHVQKAYDFVFSENEMTYTPTIEDSYTELVVMIGDDMVAMGPMGAGKGKAEDKGKGKGLGKAWAMIGVY